MNKRRKRHNPEQIVRKLRDADAMLNTGDRNQYWFGHSCRSRPFKDYLGWSAPT